MYLGSNGYSKHAILVLTSHLLCVSTEGVDYRPPPCNFTFPAGEFVDCMDLRVVNDNVIELTETLSVAVGRVFVDGQEVEMGGRLRSDVEEAVIQITDNDGM